MGRAGTENHQHGVTITRCSHQRIVAGVRQRRLQRLGVGETAGKDRGEVHLPQQQVLDLVTGSAGTFHLGPCQSVAVAAGVGMTVDRQNPRIVLQTASFAPGRQHIPGHEWSVAALGSPASCAAMSRAHASISPHSR